MSGSNTYAVSQLLGSLGAKGGQLPRLALATYQPVMVMGDFSKTLASEPLEARGLSAEWISGSAGKVCKFELRCVAPGGLVVERLCISMIQWDAQYKWASLSININSYVGGSAADIIPIGGGTPRSLVYYDEAVATGIARQATLSFPTDSRIIDLSQQRIYVPPSKKLLVQSNHNGIAMGFELIWRELPEPIGPP